MENYDKIKEIGKGSYGVVWLVKNIKDKKNYVLKRIDLRKSSERDKQSAEQEAKLLKSLKHPNIVSYKESFQEAGYLHIVMLYCDGGDLYTKIKEQNGKPLEETQIVEWFVQITMALQYMHEKNILHRDLKTQNIFLTRNKIVKVGDLGIARVLKNNTDMATTIIGTPYYMSPELFSNKPYNSKSDVWALGCVVYEMTTLKHAFNAKDMNSLVLKITRGKMPEIPGIYSKDFVALIKSMMNPDPKLRPTAQKILRDSFIKKNIILFLERTKLKQQEQLDKDFKKPPEIKEEKSANNLIRANPLPVKSEFVNLNNYQNNSDNLIQPNRISKSESDSKIIEHEKVSSEPIVEKKIRRQVRISSYVEEIEYNNNNSDCEENEPYQLTKPVKFKSNYEFEYDDYEPDIISQPKQNEKQELYENPPRVQPKIISKSAPNRSKATSQSTPDFSKQKSCSDDLQPLPPNLSARERRRQKIRLSQNDSGIPKPPQLRKLPLKPNQSDDFYSHNKNSKISKPVGISKSLNEHENQLQDSLKIFRKNINDCKIAPVSETPNLYQHQKILEQDPFFGKKNSSSSSSSSISSTDEDPNKQTLRIEKRDRKDKKETNNLIDALTLTLKTLIGINDIKDDVVDDNDDGDLLEEVSENQFKKKDYSNETPRRRGSSSSLRSLNEKESYHEKTKPITKLGQNHMLKRIEETENECIKLIGKDKVEQAYRILDSFKEDEIELKLNALVGPNNIDCIEKLKLIKVLKGASNFGIR